jgi:hypothetical protein
MTAQRLAPLLILCSSAHRTITTALLAACVGCAGLPPVPSRGGPRWLELETEHFVLYTDQNERGARSMSTKLEHRLDELMQLGFEARGRLAFKLRVIVLEDRMQFENFVGVQYSSLFVERMLGEPLVIMSRATEADSWEPINHELALFIIAKGMGPMPEWLSEGLACYFESAYDDASGSFVVGVVPRHYMAWLHRNERMRVHELLDYDGPVDRAGFYPSAWLLVHFLMTKHSTEIGAFQEALAQGKSPAESWQQAMSKLTQENIERELDHYIFLGRYVNFARHLAVKPHPASLRVLSDADVYALRAEMYLSHPGEDPDRRLEALENLRSALRSEPAHVRASALLERLQRRAPLGPDRQRGDISQRR